MTAFSEWQSFYGIVGASAGALIGLQFVVLALIAGMPGIRRGPEVSAIFATPTTVYFGAALFLAAAMSMPWHAIAPAAGTWGVGGAAGTIYSARIARRLRRQSGYQLEAEDWWFHACLPLAAFCTLIAAAACAPAHAQAALFAVAAAALLLLLIGIHNAWDTVTYHVFVRETKAGSAPAEP